MDSKDYREKIRKLLALAESPNEHEAKAALLKARQLMAEHKLTERDCKDAEKQEVKDIRTDITCSKRRNPWIVHLSAVIGENYCCKGYRNRRYGEQTNYIGFIGLEDDVEVCVSIFKYAVDCVLSEIKRIKKEKRILWSKYLYPCGHTVSLRQDKEAHSPGLHRLRGHSGQRYFFRGAHTRRTGRKPLQRRIFR